MTNLSTHEPFTLTTPVALIVFNRPHETELVFRAIAEAKPQKLYIIGDGARANRVGESEIVAQVRDIASSVDWPCEVFTNFSDQNIGCRDRIASGLAWVFDHESEAIILEDDCLPDASFFRYCQEMLEKHKDDPSISVVSGSNLTGSVPDNGDSYWYSSFVQIWGWATWKRVWDQYDVTAGDWPSYRRSPEFKVKTKSFGSRLYWKLAFNSVFERSLDTWDYQLSLLAFRHEMKSVVPKTNLISNIGFGSGATHTVDENNSFSNIPAKPLDFPLQHPKSREIDLEMDKRIQELQFKISVTKFIFSSLYMKLPSSIQKFARRFFEKLTAITRKLGW